MISELSDDSFAQLVLRSNLLSSGSVIAAKAWLLRLGQRLVSSGSIGARLAVVRTGYPVERAVVSIF